MKNKIFEILENNGFDHDSDCSKFNAHPSLENECVCELGDAAKEIINLYKNQGLEGTGLENTMFSDQSPEEGYI